MPAGRRAARCRAVLHVGRRRPDEVVHGPHPRRTDDLSRHGCGIGRPDALLRACGASVDRLRLPPWPDAHPLCPAPGEFRVERVGDVSPEACGVPHLAGHRQLLDAVVQAACGPRVPPCRAVQQPRPRCDPRPELPARAAGIDHRPALHADLGHGGRRRDVRDDDVVVRPGAPALLLDGLPRDGACGVQPPGDTRPAQHRQVVLRLLPRLHPRPLRTGLPDLFVCLGTLRREHLGQGGLVRIAQSLPDRHDPGRAGEILRHECVGALP